MNNFVVIGVFLILGVLSRYYLSKNNGISQSLSRTKTFDPEVLSNRINQYIITFCLPSIVLLKIPRMEVQQSLLIPAFTPWFLIISAIIMVLVVSRVLHWSRSTTGCLLMIVCFGNTSFFGFPLVRAFYGEAGLSYAVVYDLIGSFLSLAIVGNIIIAIYSGDEQFNWLATVKKVVLFPPFIAILIAITLRGVEYSLLITQFLSIIATTLVPTAMFLIGMHLSFRIEKDILGKLLFGISLKLLLLPTISFLLLWSMTDSITSSSLLLKVTIFEAAMPPMVTACVMAIHGNLNPKLAAAAVGAGLIFSCFTLPFWYFVT